MKIKAIKSFPISTEDRDYFFLKVETDEGIYGIGEAGISRWNRAIEQEVAHFENWLIGKDPFSTESLWQLMFRGAFFPADKVVCCAISAIDIALWDIKGKALNLPVYKLMGGPVRDKVICYPHNEGKSIEELLESCRRSIHDGWKFVRWGLGETRSGTFDPGSAIRQTVEEVQKVRQLVGDEIEICLDVHTRLDTPMTIRLAKELEPYKLFFIEDPLRSENTSSYRTLARHVSTPIAAGEQWASKWSFREVIEEELISYARIDLCIVGGITEALKITHWCETHYISIAPHNPLGPVSTAACTNLCLASSNVGVQELPVKPNTLLLDLFPVQMKWDNGYLLKSERPGLGLEFNEEAAKFYMKNNIAKPTILRRQDGSLNNY